MTTAGAMQRWIIIDVFINYRSCYRWWWCKNEICVKKKLQTIIERNAAFCTHTRREPKHIIKQGWQKKIQIKFKYVIQLTLMGHHRCRFVFIICAKIKRCAAKKATTLYAHNAAIFFVAAVAVAIGYNRNACVGLLPACVFLLSNHW